MVAVGHFFNFTSKLRLLFLRKNGILETISICIFQLLHLQTILHVSCFECCLMSTYQHNDKELLNLCCMCHTGILKWLLYNLIRMFFSLSFWYLYIYTHHCCVYTFSCSCLQMMQNRCPKSTFTLWDESEN